MSKRDIKTSTIFCISKSRQNKCAQVTSVFHLNCIKSTPKHRWFFVYLDQVEKSTSKRRRYFVHQKYVEQSTWKWRRFFAHRNYIENVRRNEIDFFSIKITLKKYVNMTWKSSIFSFPRIAVIFTSNQRLSDVMCPLGDCCRSLFLFSNTKFCWYYIKLQIWCQCYNCILPSWYILSVNFCLYS